MYVQAHNSFSNLAPMAASVKRLVRSTVFPAIAGLGLEKILWPAKPGTVILMYHGICAPGSNSMNGRHIAQDIFDEQVKYLKENFNIITLNEVYSNIHVSTENRNICITFDDGFENNLIYAKPVLNKYSVPATIFVTSLSCTDVDHKVLWNDLIDSLAQCVAMISVEGRVYENIGNRFICRSNGNSIHDVYEKSNRSKRDSVFDEIMAKYLNNLVGFRQDQWKLLNRSQLIELSADPLIDIQSHSHNHYHLAHLSESEAIDEIVRSKELLEATLKKKIDAIAFPYGSYNERVKQICLKAGYNRLVAVNYQLNEDQRDPTIVNRVGVSGTTTLASNLIHFWKDFNRNRV